MRIVAGSARGRPLLGPKTARNLRPTADRVRETLFNVLGQWMNDLEVLDLYAGTGALGLEALSRGAARATLVDSGREAISLCRANAEALGFVDQVEILAMTVDRAVDLLGKGSRSFDLIFADPPYALETTAVLLQKVDEAKLLREGGTLCIEHSTQEVTPKAQGAWSRVDQRRMGDTCISLYRFA